ncbi:retrovirus-related Pol polyprotein from transposon 17.6 [Trichonephila clavipes]|nr:retrovirus-related Pol polyprotein from transposon 17.6 [Trichonephila clavipes]
MRLEELERAEKMRLEELVKEQALKEKELQLKFDLERFKIESGFRSNPVERFHRTLKRLLRVLCLDAGSNGTKHLPSILLALRTVSQSTGYTPSELVYGKNLRTPETLVMEHWMEPEERG